MKNVSSSIATLAAAVFLILHATKEAPEAPVVIKEPVVVKTPEVVPDATEINWVKESEWRKAALKKPGSVIWFSFELETGCAACVVVKNNVYPNKHIISETSNMICVKLTSQSAGNRWKVSNYPSSIFVDSKGDLLMIKGQSRLSTPRTPRGMLTLLREAKNVNYRNIRRRNEDFIHADVFDAGIHAVATR